MDAWLRDILLSAARIVVPAILIALVGQFFILRWQHRYWRLQKISGLQDETYREAKRLLVNMAYFPERLLSDVSFAIAPEATAPPPGSVPAALAQTASCAIERSVADRIALANLSSDVHRLFSPKVYASTADAAMELCRYQDSVGKLIVATHSPSGQPPLEAHLQRGRCVFKVRQALDLLAGDIGRDLSGGFFLRRRAALFGRRREDLPEELLDWIGGVPTSAREDSGRRRRLVDKLMAGRLPSKSESPDTGPREPDAPAEDV